MMTALSERTRTTLTQLTTALETALSDNLVSLTAASTPLVVPATDDDRLSVLVVLKSATPEVLHTIAPPIRAAAKVLSNPPFVITHDDLGTSTDIFPVRYRNLQAEYEVLSGVDVLGNLEFDPEHLRLRCEQELSNVLHRLRNRYLAEYSRPRVFAATLQRAARPFLIALSAAVELVAGLAPIDIDSTIEAAASSMNLDRDALAAVREIALSTSAPPADELNADFASFVSVLSAAISAVDQLDTSNRERIGS